MKKRILSFLLVLCLVVSMLPIAAFAANGTLNDPWVSGSVKIYKDGSTLHVFGSGSMTDYAAKSDTPWYSAIFIASSLRAKSPSWAPTLSLPAAA